MPRHRIDETRDQLRVPVLARRYSISHPGRLTTRTLTLARRSHRADTNALPVIVARASAPLTAVPA